ncbi:tripartite motif-containing protein 2 [Lingula anatina]|uniref:Tripartite motif-containing protein 2 n=1 Tax=Lingula anatina TaxID=7574 RepID=A0A1S3JTH7_LINAN|nr:tripartite motif-containing protein 2 [Lingula anatina]|eukprot:XP_013413670.1 tripartite motif-containing protein 2 [Lingula anatina]
MKILKMAKALATAFVDNLLTCSICLEEYEDPRVLTCNHTFCLKCITDHGNRTQHKNEQDGFQFLCPLCREPNAVPSGGLRTLKKNFAFIKAIEILEEQQKNKDEEQATIDEVKQAISKLTIQCQNHSGRELLYYCSLDETTVCGDCIIDYHQGHKCVRVEDVAENEKERLKSAIEKPLQELQRLKQEEENATRIAEQRKRQREAVVSDIKQDLRKIVEAAEDHSRRLNAEVASVEDDETKQLEAFKDELEMRQVTIHSACEFAEQLIQSGTDAVVMSQSKALLERLSNLSESLQTDIPLNISMLDFSRVITYKPIDRSLDDMLGNIQVSLSTDSGEARQSGRERRLFSRVITPEEIAAGYTVPLSRSSSTGSTSQSSLEERPLLKQTFNAKLVDDKDRCSVSDMIVDDSYIYLADMSNNRVKILTHSGQIQTVLAANEPGGVEVLPNGDICVSIFDDQLVRVFDAQGRQSMTLGKGLMKEPFGVTMISQNQLVICDSVKKRLVILEPTSGKHLSSIALDMCNIPCCIAVNLSNGSIIVSDYGGDCVFVMTLSGEVIAHYGSPGCGDGELWQPKGVCSDSSGRIFIADYWNHRVVMISKYGRFLKNVVTREDGLKNPQAVAFDTQEQLVVAEESGFIKTFQISL